MKIGFIGIGDMGLPMASNIMPAGFFLSAFDIDEAPLHAIQQRGSHICSSSKEVAAGLDIIITMRSDSAIVEQAILGKDGVVSELREGSIVVEMSTTYLNTIFRVRDAVAKLKAHTLDAPVSSTPQMAEKGELTIMVGGDRAVMEKAMPVLKAMGSKVLYGGGCGQRPRGQICE